MESRVAGAPLRSAPAARLRESGRIGRGTKLDRSQAGGALFDADVDAPGADASDIERLKPSPHLPESSPAIARRVAALSLPVVVEQALLYLVGLSDTILAGRYLAADYLAGVTVSSYLLWVVGSLLTIVSVGATALVARMTGAGDRASAARICQQAIGLALLAGDGHPDRRRTRRARRSSGR